MIIRINNNKKIFVKNNLDLRPILNKITVDEKGDENYHYTFFIGIDRRNYENNNIDYIGLKITGKESISNSKNKNIGKSFFDSNKKYKNPGAIIKGIQFGLNKKFIDTINYRKKTSSKSLKEKKFFISLEVMSNILSKNSKNDFEKYGEATGYNEIKVKEKYNFSPSALRPIMNTAIKQRIHKNTIQGNSLGNKLLLSSDDEILYKKNPVKVSKRNISIPINVTIKKSDFEKINSNRIYFIANFIAKDKKGIAIDNNIQLIKHEKHLNFYNIKNLNINDFRYVLERNKIFTGIQNAHLKSHNVAIKGNIFLKELTLHSKEKEYKTVLKELPLKDRSFIVNNKTGVESFAIPELRNKNNIVKSRITYKIDNLEIDNYSEEIITSPGMLDKVYVPFYVTNIFEEGKLSTNITIPGDYIEPNLSRINLLKRKSKSCFGFENSFEYVMNDNFDDILFAIPEQNTGLVLTDNNVKSDTSYEYKLELIYDNRKKMQTVNTFATKLLKPSNIVEIELLDAQRNKIVVKTNIIKNDSEKVFKQLYGNIFELFKEDLKDIRGLTHRSIILRVDKINIETGEILKYKDFEVDENGISNIEIKNKNSESFIYKIRPCVRSIAESLSFLKKSLENDMTFKPGNSENFAILRNSMQKDKKDVISFIGDKYTKKSYYTRSLIEKNDYDLYENAETGDNLYVENYILSKSKPKNVIDDAYYVTYDNKFESGVSYELPNRNNKEIIYVVTIAGKYSNSADHLNIVYVQNGKMFDSEKGHINKEKYIHKILFKCPRGIGKKDIYCYIVDKNGMPLEKINVRSIDSVI